jgi:predicted permease
MLENLWSDFRYAARSLGRSPGFSAAAIVTIALGIGLNAGVFTVLNGVLFRDLPAPSAHELVSIEQTVTGWRPTATTGVGTFSASEFHAYRDQTRTLSGVLAHSNPTEATLGGNAPQMTFGVLVSCNYFGVLEQPPALGRALAAEDCALGAPPVVVLGHSLWATSFSADPRVVGRTIELNRQLFTVVGVSSVSTYGGSPMAPGFFAPISTDPLLGRSQTRFEDDRFLWLHLIGRRSGGSSLEQVRAELGVIAAEIDQLYPGRSTMLAIERATPMTLPSHLRTAAMGAGAVLMAAFGLILLIACANVANLLLARGTARAQELGIRLSLGASRSRVVRQLMTESLVISVAGGVIGCAIALQSFDALVAVAVPALVPPEFPSFTLDVDLSPDWRVLAFALALTLVTGFVFGVAPALHVSKPDLHAVMKQSTAGAGDSRRGGRLRGTLVGVQVGLSMAMMIAAGLLLRGLHATHTVDPGFAYGNIAYVTFGLDGLRTDDPVLLRQRLRDEVVALPGVEAVAYASDPPLGESMARMPIRLPEEPEADVRFADFNSVTPGYFSLVEIPILRGRTFTESEMPQRGREVATRPVIVSETTARTFWPGRDPIGRSLLSGDQRLEVVGVAADAQVSTLGRIDAYYLYLPGEGQLLVKSRSELGTLASSIHAIVRSLDPALVVSVIPLERNIGWYRGLSATVTTLGAGLGILALVLASVGIYGVVAYSVTRRYREIGIRMALGAESRSVLGLLLRQTMRPVVVGAVIGVAAATFVSRVLGSVFFGVSPADMAGIGGAVLVVIGVALAAGILAARPAAHTDPTTALRHE